jgi:hypothetical protein
LYLALARPCPLSAEQRKTFARDQFFPFSPKAAVRAAAANSFPKFNFAT